MSLRASQALLLLPRATHRSGRPALSPARSSRTRPMRCLLGPLLLAGVGCGGDSDPIQQLDVGPIQPAKCDLRAQSGCNLAEKCTWIVEESPRGGCTPEGGIQIGQFCERTSNGADECIVGAACLEAACRQICSLEDGVPLCFPGFRCVPYPSQVEQTSAGV